MSAQQSANPIVELVSRGHWLLRTRTGEYLDVDYDPHTGAPQLHTAPISRVRHAFRITRVADEKTHTWQVMLDPVGLDGAPSTAPATPGTGHAASLSATKPRAAQALQLPMRLTHHGCTNFEITPLPHHVAASMAAASPAQSVGAMALGAFLATPAAADLSLTLTIDLPKLATMSSGIPFPTYTGNAKLAFDYIAQTLHCKNLHSDALNEPLLTSVKRPPHIEEHIWDTVTTQLKREIGDRMDVDLLFHPLRDFVQFVFTDQSGLVDTVGDYIKLDGSQIVNIMVHGFLKGVAGAVGKLPFTGSGLVSAALQGGVELLVADRSLTPQNLAVAKANARDSMSTLFNSLMTAILKARKHVVEDYGLLQGMAQAIRSGDPSALWPEPDEDRKLREAARKELEIELWKAMLKLRWHHMTDSDDPGLFKAYGQANKDAYEASNPHYWVEFWPGSKVNTMGKTDNGILVRYHWLGYGSTTMTHHAPSAEMCQRLFTHLGVSKKEVFTDQAWGLTAETFADTFGGFSP